MVELADILKIYEPDVEMMKLERHAFYARAEGAFAIVQSGETRLYGNVLLKKGVIRPERLTRTLLRRPATDMMA